MDITCTDLALRCFQRHRNLHSLAHYSGILSLQGLARLALLPDTAASVLQLVRSELRPFIDGHVLVGGSFVTYHSGGNGAAYLFLKGQLPAAEQALRQRAEEQLAAPRGQEGIYCRPQPKEVDQGRIWIDTAFAVTPYLVACGLAMDEPDWIADGIHQLRGLRRLLYNTDTGLVHQGINFNGPGSISQDHWSRGNGWGLLALAELVDLLPPEHPERAQAMTDLEEWLRAALRYQNGEGLWFQEMCVDWHFATYTETSGSGLILYALGLALQHGLMSDCHAAWLKGTRSLLRYVSSDGDVFNCCTACCCPGDGSVAAFLRRPPIRNDKHAFGPIILALLQAQALGYHQLQALPEAEARLGDDHP